MTARVLVLAALYGVVSALAVGVAERAGSIGRIVAIVIVIALFAPYVYLIVGQSRGNS